MVENVHKLAEVSRAPENQSVTSVYSRTPEAESRVQIQAVRTPPHQRRQLPHAFTSRVPVPYLWVVYSSDSTTSRWTLYCFLPISHLRTQHGRERNATHDRNSTSRPHHLPRPRPSDWPPCSSCRCVAHTDKASWPFCSCNRLNQRRWAYRQLGCEGRPFARRDLCQFGRA